jgi:hypothetical protein
MSKMKLSYSAWVQGECVVRELNLLLVFQISCPGCLLFALPFTEKLFHKYSAKELNILGLATAASEYQINTLNNLRAFLKNGYLMNEALSMIDEYAILDASLRVSFPVGFDTVIQAKKNINRKEKKKLIDHICGQYTLTEDDEHHIVQKVEQKTKKKEYWSYTYDYNQFQGTPTWILFDKEYTILGEWYGHAQELERALPDLLVCTR